MGGSSVAYVVGGRNVTGVQTCALPISLVAHAATRRRVSAARILGHESGEPRAPLDAGVRAGAAPHGRGAVARAMARLGARAIHRGVRHLDRKSVGRESVQAWVGAVSRTS